MQWISKDVLPSIRRTGVYAAPPPSQPRRRTDMDSRRVLLETDIENERLEVQRAEAIISNAPRIREADRVLRARVEERNAIKRMRCEEARMVVETERALRESQQIRMERLEQERKIQAASSATAANATAASGPAASGPAASGPAASGPAASGPASDDKPKTLQGIRDAIQRSSRRDIRRAIRRRPRRKQILY